MQLVLCLHWFNPLVHWMVGATARACELSCDSAVVKSFSAVERSMYGDALLDSLKSPGEYREGVYSFSSAGGGSYGNHLSGKYEFFIKIKNDSPAML